MQPNQSGRAASAALALLLAWNPSVAAQAAGLRGGSSPPITVHRLGPPSAEQAERVITIEASAQIRVRPSALRIVIGLSATGATASAASASARLLVSATQAKLGEIQIAGDAMDVDFIAAVPIYRWRVQTQDKRQVLAEVREGTRVQYNLHVTVPDEAGALRAIEAATAEDGVELLAVDYWSDDLEKQQLEAQRQALVAAKRKAELLLSVFPAAPTPINVWEDTQILFPSQLYETVPALEDRGSVPYRGSRDRLPQVPATRLQRVYYKGLFRSLDRMDPELPGRRDIEVVSTVRLYYKAPERPVRAAR